MDSRHGTEWHGPLASVSASASSSAAVVLCSVLLRCPVQE
jgi:hypothetical protein